MAGNKIRVATEIAGVGRASSDLDNLKDKFAKLQSQGAKGFAIGAGAAITTKAFDLMGSAASMAADFIGDSIGAASDMNETLSKSKVIFGDSAKTVEGFGDTAAKSMGISKQAAIEASATFGNLFVGLDLGQQKAADMSKGIVTLAGDLASFNNLDPTEVLEKLRSGLAGEAEPLRSLGVFLNEAKIKAKATEMGLADAHGELSDGAKVLARYQLILDSTTTAQGDFARTADGLANSQRIVNAQLKDQQAILGEKLLPIQLALTQTQVRVIDNLDTTTTAVRAGSMGWVGMFEALGDTGDALDDLILRGGKTKAEVQGLASMADHAAETFDRHMRPAITETGNAAGDTAGTLRRDLSPSIDELDRMARDAADSMDELTDAIYGPTKRKGELAELIEQRRDLVKAGPDSKSISDQDIYNGKLADMNAKILEAGELVAADKGPAALLDWFRKTGAAIGDADSEAAGLLAHMRALADLSGQLPALTGGSWGAIVPGKAAGGPVSGGKPFLVGERGPELFVPQSSGNIVPNGAGGSVILNATFNVSGSVSPEQFARDALQALKREVGRQGMSL